MINNFNYLFNDKNEHQQDDQITDQLPQIFRKKFQSKSLDNLKLFGTYKNPTDNPISSTTKTEADLTNIGCNEISLNDNEKENFDDLKVQRSQSAPVSPTKFYDREFTAFLQSEQQQQQLIADSFVYNIDLSDTNQTSHSIYSRAEIFDDDDYTSEDLVCEPVLSNNNTKIYSLINTCLTITEENEEELEELRRGDDNEQQTHLNKLNHLLKINDGSMPTVILHDDDDRADILENDEQLNKMNSSNINQDYDERLSTIYESPSPIPRDDDDQQQHEDIYDKLIIYDIVNAKPIKQSPILNNKIGKSVNSPSLACSSLLDKSRFRSCFTSTSFQSCLTFPSTPSASHLCGTTNMINSKVFQPPIIIHHNEKSILSPVSDNRNISINKSLASLPVHQESPSKSSPISLSVPMLLLSNSIEENHISIHSHSKQIKGMQSSSSSLSDFINPTPSSTLKSTIDYEEVPSVHQSLTDCSTINRISCCTSILDENSSKRNKSFDDEHQRRPSLTRRILTNGLLLSYCSNTNPTHRRTQPPLTFNQYRYQTKPKSEEKLSSLSSPIVSSSSSSSQSNSPSGDKFMSKSDYLFQQQQQQQQQNLSQQRKATSLKTISNSPKIVYPIDFERTHTDQSWYDKHSTYQHKVPTSDSGIVIDTDGTRPTSKSSIDETDVDAIPIDNTNSTKLKQYEQTYRKTLTELNLIKTNIVDIESRLAETMRELEIERALVEGEHEIVYKQILDASENDQEKLHHLYNDLQLLIERIMAEKSSIRNEINFTQQILYKLEYELRQLEQQYRPSDDKILKKKETIVQTRKKHEDLEFQLMELETRCEAELEQAEEHFQNEQILVTQNSQIRQNTLRELDHQQNVMLHQVILEKDKLEREKQKLKLLFKQKKFEVNELEQKINGLSSPHAKDVRFSGITAMYHSSPSNLFNYSEDVLSPIIESKDKYQEKLNEIKEMIAVAKLEKMTLLEQQLREQYNELVKSNDEQQKSFEVHFDRDYFNESQVKLREKSRIQERPLTRYLPNRSADFDLRAHIENAGHLLNSSHINLSSTSCRGFLLKMGGMKFKTWNRRWFVFDRKRRSLFYYQDKTETKLRGCIYFQSILEVYVDHLQSISLRSPEPRQATFIVKTLERSYYLVAPTVETMRIWVDVIITGAEGNTFAGDN